MLVMATSLESAAVRANQLAEQEVGAGETDVGEETVVEFHEVLPGALPLDRLAPRAQACLEGVAETGPDRTRADHHGLRACDLRRLVLRRPLPGRHAENRANCCSPLSADERHAIALPFSATPSLCRHAGHAHAFVEAFALRQIDRVGADDLGAQLGDGELRCEKQAGIGRLGRPPPAARQAPTRRPGRNGRAPFGLISTDLRRLSAREPLVRDRCRQTDEKVPEEEERIARTEPHRFRDMGPGLARPPEENFIKPEIGVGHGEIALQADGELELAQRTFGRAHCEQDRAIGDSVRRRCPAPAPAPLSPLPRPRGSARHGRRTCTC